MRHRRPFAHVLVASVIAVTLVGPAAPPAAANTPVVEWGGYYAEKVFDGHAPRRFTLYVPQFDREVMAWSVRVTSTSDPVGITVKAHHDLTDQVFFGEVHFTSGPSDDRHDRIRVADGDDVTLTYRGAGATARDTAGWRAISQTPDFRHLVFGAPETGAVVYGGPAAVAPRATVTVRDASQTVLTTAVADAAGAFEIPVPGGAALTDVRLTADEAGLPTSHASWVPRSHTIGRILTSDGHPVDNAFVYIRPPGGCGVAVACKAGQITGSDGRFGFQEPLVAGSNLLTVSVQGHAAQPFSDLSYGTPPPTPVTIDPAKATVDAGVVRLTPPNLTVRAVDGDGWPIANAEVQVEGGPWPAWAHTYQDGRFPLHLGDGSYKVTVGTWGTCAPHASKTWKVSVAGGVATPTSLTLTATGAPQTREASAPLPSGLGAVEAEIQAANAEVAVDLEGIDGKGALRTACVDEPLPENLVTLASRPVELATGKASFKAAEVCLRYSPEQLKSSGLTVADLQVLHVDDGGRVHNVTTRRDTTARQVCGRTTSFSPFALGYRKLATNLEVAVSKGTIVHGDSVRVTGTLTRTTGAAVPSRKVTLQRRWAGSTTWTNVTSATTKADGKVSFAVAPSKNVEYRLRHEAGPKHRAAQSERRAIAVRPALTARPSATTLAAGTTLSVRGRATPAHHGHEVRLQELRNGTWSTVARTKLAPEGGYRLDVKSSRGTRTYRVVLPAHTDHALGRSVDLRIRIT